ncbi:MAG: PAS domain S-box protein, partial [Desulfovibrionaceae bacterium]
MDRLRQSESSYRELVEACAMPVLVHQGGEVVFLNRAAAAAIGASDPSEGLGLGVSELFAPSQRVVHQGGMQAQQKGRSAEELIPVRLRRLDGQVREVLHCSTPFSYQNEPAEHVVFHDVTEQAQAMRRLQESEERFRRLYENAPVAYQSLDENGDFLMVNRAFCNVLGYEPEEVVGRNFGDFLHPDWVEHFKENFPRFKAVGEIMGVEFDMVRKDGDVIHVSFNGIIDRDDDGRFRQTHCVFQDVTQRRRAQQELERARADAERAARSKSDFLATMSHEIRTPLNGLLGMLQLTRMGELDASQAEYLDAAMEAGLNLVAIINDVLDLSRIEAGKLELVPERVDLAKLLDRVVGLFRSQVERKGLRLWWEKDDALPDHAVTDPGRLRQILLNLVSNAVKFTPKGSVKVLAELRQEPDDDGRMVVSFTVADTGPGIPPEFQQRLFEPFTQNGNDYRTQHEGSGLGLSIVRRLAELFGGGISLESEPGRGAAFRVDLPMRKSQDPARSTQGDDEARIAAARALKGRRVLVVDDERISRKVACGLLAGNGLIVDAAEDGEGALEALRQNDYDCVLLDVQMPGMSGLDVVRRIRADADLPGGLPVVGLTGHVLPGQRREFLEAGMDACMSKPMDCARTLKVLIDLLGED